MSPDVTRVMIVVVAVAVTLGLAWWARRRVAHRGASVDAAGLLDGPGVVIFTKDDCATCIEMLERLARTGLPIRQVRAEDEAAELERRAVTAVPVTVIQDDAGRPVAQFRGVPRSAALRRAVRRVGEIPDARPREL